MRLTPFHNDAWVHLGVRRQFLRSADPNITQDMKGESSARRGAAETTICTVNGLSTGYVPIGGP